MTPVIKHIDPILYFDDISFFVKQDFAYMVHPCFQVAGMTGFNHVKVFIRFRPDQPGLIVICPQGWSPV